MRNGKAFMCDWISCGAPAPFIHVGKHSDYFYCERHHEQILAFDRKKGRESRWADSRKPPSVLERAEEQPATPSKTKGEDL